MFNYKNIKEGIEKSMDPLTGLISIISLVSIFKQEGKEKENQKYTDFKDWLEEHRFNQIIEHITHNYDLQKQITDILNANQEEILSGVTAINYKLDALISTTVFEPLSNSKDLSEQSKEILDAFYSDEYHTMIPFPGSNGEIMLSKAPNGSDGIQVDHLYLESDLEDLVSKNFLLQDYNNSGEPFYRKTRDGLEYYKKRNNK
ncbi:MAG: hypothetical protein NE327_01140 [Lentisphaeraceae bacterium]|nr:hypothetical protein [Lentisphaeraceae bacterium]